MKKGVICYYSATGNTRLAVEYLQKRISNAAVELFDITKGTVPALDNYDFAGFATFTDWGDPPYLLRVFADKLPRQENKPAFLLNTCAGFSGKTLKTLKEMVGSKGFRVIAAFTLNAPESYPPMVAKGRTKEKNPSPADLAAFHAFIDCLNSLLAAAGDPPEVRPKLGLLNTLMPRFPRDKSKKAMGQKYADKDLCNRCGVCTGVCAYKAIKMDAGPVFDEKKCYGCWACYNHCPTKAIYTEKVKDKGHYSVLTVYKNKLK